MATIAVKQNSTVKDNSKKKTNDTFVVQDGVTSATITSSKGSDTIDLTKLSNYSYVSMEQKTGTRDLLIYAKYDSKTATITVKNYFTSTAASATKSTLTKIKYKNSDGDVVTKKIMDTEYGIETAASYTRTFKPNSKNVVTGTAFNDKIDMSGQNKKLTIKSGSGYDTIYASQKGSNIYTGAGDDTIYGGKGNDTIHIGNGDYNNIYISKDHGNDVIYTGTKSMGNTINYSGVNSSDLTFKRKGNDVIITNKNTAGKNETVTVKDYFKNNCDNVNVSGYGSLYNAFGTQTINKSKAKKGQTIKATLLNDSITGSKYADKIYSNGGYDTITAGKGNDKIYLTRDYDKSTNKRDCDAELYFSKGSGKDTIYGINEDAEIYFNDLKYEDRSKLSFTKSGKNLIIKRSDSTKDSITLNNYFWKNTYDSDAFWDIYMKNAENNWKGIDLEYHATINVSGKGTIKGSFLSDFIKGSTKADKMYGYEGNDVFYGGKGNDTIYTTALNKYDDYGESYVLIGKGDGNDVININKKADETYLVFNKDPDFSFSKKGNDLVITAAHVKESKDKSAVKENVTIKNYFNDGSSSMQGDANYDNVYLAKTDNPSQNLASLNNYDKVWDTGIGKYYNLYSKLRTSTITQKGNLKKDNYLIGSSFTNDVIYGGNKNDYMSSFSGNNTFYTGKTGGSIIISGAGDDNYIISSIRNRTVVIETAANTGYQGDTVQINGANANDLFMYFDVSQDTGIMGSGYSYSSAQGKEVLPIFAALHLMNGSDFTTNLKNNNFAIAPTKEAINKKKDLSPSNTKITKVGALGVTINDYFGDGSMPSYSASSGYDFSEYFQTGGYFNSGSYYMTGGYGAIEHITLADSKGNNAKELNSRNIRSAVLNTFYKVENFLDKTGYTDTQQLLNYVKTTLNKKETKKMTKAQKTALANQKKAANTLLTQLTNIYKSERVGTSGNDTFTNIKTNNVVLNGNNISTDTNIYSGTGSDTFKFAKNFGEVSIYSLYNMGAGERDKLVFSDYSFENRTLGIAFYDGYEIDVWAFKSPYTSSYSPDNTAGNVYYSPAQYSEGYTGTVGYGAFGKSLTIQDSKRTYNVSYIGNSFPYAFTSEMNLSATTGNNIINVVGNKSVYNDVHLLTSKGYNVVCASNYAGSDGYIWDMSIYNTGGHDIYTMYGDIDNNYSIMNFDKNTSVSINDSSGDDSLYIEGSLNNMRLFFDVSTDYGTYGNLIIMDNSNMTQSNLANYLSNTKGVLLENFFNSDIQDDIEIKDSTTHASVDEDGIAYMIYGSGGSFRGIAQEVASWLSTKHYESTDAVFAGKKTDDINALIAIYKNYSIEDILI